MAASSAKKNDGDKKKTLAVSAAKGMAAAYALTAAVFIGYAALLTYTGVSERYISLVALICTLAASAIAGFDTAAGAGERGLIWGIAAGLLYAVILLAVAMLCGDGFKLTPGFGATVAIALAGGGIGGVLGVNRRQK